MTARSRWVSGSSWAHESQAGEDMAPRPAARWFYAGRGPDRLDRCRNSGGDCSTFHGARNRPRGGIEGRGRSSKLEPRDTLFPRSGRHAPTDQRLGRRADCPGLLPRRDHDVHVPRCHVSFRNRSRFGTSGAMGTLPGRVGFGGRAGTVPQTGARDLDPDSNDLLVGQVAWTSTLTGS